MHTRGRKIKVFSCNANQDLAKAVCAELGLPLGDSVVKTFSDGEISVNIDESVRGVDVYVVQSFSLPKVNDYLMELLIMIDALKRASAGRITAVVPYYGYARQDRKAKARDPISAKLVANLIVAAGADRVLTMDLHASQIQGYFDIPVDHLKGSPILAEYFLEKQIEDLVVVAPDLGSVTRSRDFSYKLNANIAIVDKRRPEANVSEIMNIIGDIKDKNVILIDDMIDTAGTIVNAVKALKSLGAKDVYACCTHGVFSGPAAERIKDSGIKELVVLDTIDLSDEMRALDNIKILSVAPVFAEAIRRIFNNDSVSTMFEN
ncbi:ribose-phosphate pyrophosphokinase [Fusibacter tunisiensis]|jgi:ribose-phosphate pyrophosphokinase|uniref:Ribose-phosphate pyrophosphokinase n=1 Tax=Fusibacter tunisiensis TaxID=1008308 RepID=A0ABS2MRA1_9FIRM|nr:ribose-phosphate pyrophosphokinase [Fusibacter tunisiensis]MBM7561897.1 ribose-phosphate pyrophosphokinase [Fusibacter tunisiensis]